MKKTYSVFLLVSNYTTKINHRSVKMFKRSLSNVKISEKDQKLFMNNDTGEGQSKTFLKQNPLANGFN